MLKKSLFAVVMALSLSTQNAAPMGKLSKHLTAKNVEKVAYLLLIGTAVHNMRGNNFETALTSILAAEKGPELVTPYIPQGLKNWVKTQYASATQAVNHYAGSTIKTVTDLYTTAAGGIAHACGWTKEKIKAAGKGIFNNRGKIALVLTLYALYSRDYSSECPALSDCDEALLQHAKGLFDKASPTVLAALEKAVQSVCKS